jgi:hypothetical protein
VCRRCATDKMFERNYVVNVDTCSDSQLTRFHHLSAGYDPRVFSPLRPVYIRHDKPYNLVTITAEESSKSLLSSMNELQEEYKLSMFERKENVPCRDIHTLKELSETKKQQREKEADNPTYHVLMKFARISQDITSYLFDCERNGFDVNYLENTRDMFSFLILFIVLLVLL